MAISALPPKAKITAEVCSGRETPEIGPGQIEIERRKGELPGDDIADEEADDPPEHGGDHAGADHAVGIAGFGLGSLCSMTCVRI